MMRMIKVGDRYLALVDDRDSALLFHGDFAQTSAIASAIGDGAHVSARSVRLRQAGDPPRDSVADLTNDPQSAVSHD